jgi:membrane fusion protein (multidrug efflux system)
MRARSSLRLLSAAVATLFALGCGLADQQTDQQHGPPPPVVETIVVQPEDVRDVLEFVGQLDSAYSVVLAPEISGVVESIAFEEGSLVEKGEPLIYLRDAEQRARVREAEANVSLTRSNYKRAKELAEQRATSVAGLDRARAEFEIAAARLDLAKVELSRTVVRAPFNGVVGARLVSPGERVSPGRDRDSGGEGGGGGSGPSGLVRIDSLDEMELVFTLPETVMALAREGMKVELEVSPHPGEKFPGTVYFVDPRVDAVSRRVLVKARVPNPEHKLKPGLFAELQVLISSRENAIMVPEDAIVYGREGVFVWRIENGQAVQVPVEIGIRQPGRVELRSGVEPGDRIVSAGTHKLRVGSPVRDLARQQDDEGIGES